MLQVMTFSIGVIESDTVSTSNMPQLSCAKFQNSESTSFLPNESSKFQNRYCFARISKFRVNFFSPGEFCPKAAELEDGYDLFVQDGEVLLLISIHDHL